MTSRRRNIVLVADDFAISDGVCDGIEQLARGRRLSGTSAIVTLPRWTEDGRRLTALRQFISIGLHINLTLGTPLGAMLSIAPTGVLPSLKSLVAAAMLRRIDRNELAAEIERQLDRFEAGTGHKPDHIDGHQHVHALPVVRDALTEVLQRRYEGRTLRPMVRNPVERLGSPSRAAGTQAKAAVLGGLAAGFGRCIIGAGFPVNDSFAGVTSFRDSEDDVHRDLTAAAHAKGTLHLVMCHPGVPTPELAALDRITERRAAELAVLGGDHALTGGLWLPQREAEEPIVDWRRVREEMA